MNHIKSEFHRTKQKRHLSNEVSLDYFDELHTSSSNNMKRVNNVDVLSSNDFKESLLFCRLAAFLPLSRLNSDNKMEGDAVQLNGALAILMAMKHLNTGNGTVVKEVEGLNDRCNIRFTGEFFDTERQESKAIDQLLNLLSRKPSLDQQLPCSFLGASRTAVSIPMSIIAGIEGYPQISHFSTGSQLDDKTLHKLFGRVIPSDDGTALPVISFIHNVLDERFLGVIHVDDAYGHGYVSSLQKVVNSIAPDMTIQSIDIPYHNPTPQHIELAIRFLASTHYRFFFGIITQAFYNEVMTEAYLQGIAGPGFTWIFADSLSLDAIAGKNFEKNSPLAIASSGSSILSASSTVASKSAFDSFRKAWNELNTVKDIGYIQSKLPNYKEDADNVTPMSITNLFQNPTLTGASFLYDATIATGLAACHLNRNDEPFDGKQHYKTILQTTFMGSSGNVTFDPTTGTRIPASATFELTNFQAHESNDEFVIFSSKTVKLFQNGKWVGISPYIFADGTTNIPIGIPKSDMNYNYLGTVTRTIGLLLCILILVTSLLFGIWTHRNRKSRVVIASQPLFMYIISFGTFVMGCSILALSIDDQIATTNACNHACVATPWLFSCGFAIAFSALFSKTMRLNQILTYSRRNFSEATTKEMLDPMAFLLFTNIVILTIWTVVSPQRWIRTVTSTDVFGRATSSVGYCDSEKSLPFVILLIVIALSAMGYALYQAYIGRHISTQLGDTKLIALTIACFILGISMGIPIIIIVIEEPKAVYFVKLTFIFLACVPLYLFVLWPKIKLHQDVKNNRVSLTEVINETITQAARKASMQVSDTTIWNSQEDIRCSIRMRMSTIISPISFDAIEDER